MGQNHIILACGQQQQRQPYPCVCALVFGRKMWRMNWWHGCTCRASLMVMMMWATETKPRLWHRAAANESVSLHQPVVLVGANDSRRFWSKSTQRMKNPWILDGDYFFSTLCVKWIAWLWLVLLMGFLFDLLIRHVCIFGFRCCPDALTVH